MAGSSGSLEHAGTVIAATGKRYRAARCTRLV
jgi:hypothetical protein